jgi:hypothetical protein
MKVNEEIESNPIVKDTRSIKEKQSALEKLGIKISIISREEKYIDGYTLGRMKDKYRKTEVF